MHTLFFLLFSGIFWTERRLKRYMNLFRFLCPFVFQIIENEFVAFFKQKISQVYSCQAIIMTCNCHYDKKVFNDLFSIKVLPVFFKSIYLRKEMQITLKHTHNFFNYHKFNFIVLNTCFIFLTFRRVFCTEKRSGKRTERWFRLNHVSCPDILYFTWQYFMLYT